MLLSTKQGKKMETTPKGIISETLVGHIKPLENVVEKTSSEDFKKSATDMADYNRTPMRPFITEAESRRRIGSSSATLRG